MYNIPFTILVLSACDKVPKDCPWVVNVNVANIEKPNPYLIQIGLFSISDNVQVRISQGNLQYKDATYRFAPSQLHCCHIPGMNNEGYEDLFPYAEERTHLTINGQQWRMLALNEWKYLLYQRANAELLLGQARVEGLNGLILLPDAWQGVNGITFVPSPKKASENTYSIDEWHSLEEAGAIFLPAAGFYQKGDVQYVGLYGYYWSLPGIENGATHDYYMFSGQKSDAWLNSVDGSDGNYPSATPLHLSIRLVK